MPRAGWVLCVAGLLWAAGSVLSAPPPKPPAKPPAEQQVTVAGILEAAALDASNQVTAVALAADDGRYFVVGGEGKGPELIPHAGKRVRCQGKVRETAEGDFVLIVDFFEVVEN